MKLIPLSTNYSATKNKNAYFAQVDDEDYEWLNKWKWYAHSGENDRTLYARRSEWSPEFKKQITIRMHRFIMGLTNPKTMCDHKDGNGLNNQRSNLRACTSSQNGANRRRPSIKKTSKYIGVSRKTNSTKWVAQLAKNRQKIFIGHFDSEIDAAKAYDKKAKEIHGEFATLNFK